MTNTASEDLNNISETLSRIKHELVDIEYENSSSVMIKKEVSTEAQERSNDKYNCVICKDKFNNTRNLKAHFRELHDDKEDSIINSEIELVCPDCSKQFSNKGNLNIHLMLDSKCGKAFKAKPLQYKLQNQCPNCDEIFCSVGDLNMHLLTDVKCGKPLGKPRIEERTVKREIFVKDFKRKKNHMIYNDNKKTFLCGECGKRFSHLRNLKQHMITHEIVKLDMFERAIVR